MKEFLIKIKAMFEGSEALGKADAGVKRLRDRLGECIKTGAMFGGAMAAVVNAVANLAVQIGTRAVQSVAQLAGEFINGVKGAADFAGQMSDLGAQTGQSVRDVVLLQQAFKNAGLGSEAVGQSLNLLQKALTGLNEEGKPTSEVFARLGLSIESLKHMSATDQLEAISAAIAGLPTPADQARAAMEMFGRSGGRMLALLKDSSAFDTARTMVGGLAESIGQNVEKLDAFSDSIGALDTKKMTFFAGFANGLAGDLGRASEAINAIDLTNIGTQAGEVTAGLIEMVAEFKRWADGAEEFAGKIPGGGVAKWMMGNLTGQNALNWVGGQVEMIRRIGVDKAETERLNEFTKRTNAELAERGKSGPAKSPKDQELDAMLSDSRERARQEQADKDRLNKGLKKGATDAKFDALPTKDKLAEVNRLGNEQMSIFNSSKSSAEEKEAAEKLILDLYKQQILLKRQLTKEEADAASKRAAGKSEADLLEAQGAGNTKRVKEILWTRDFNAEIDKGSTEWDARRIANMKAVDDPEKEKKDAPDAGELARRALSVSSMARIGGAVGESMQAAGNVELLRKQIEHSQKIREATEATAKTTKELLKKGTTYQ